MAEFIELRLERMMPELEQMKRIKLYEEKEILNIIKKRKEFEYKIGRTSKQKQDFLNYISYEVKLIRHIKLRRNKHRINEKRSDIEYAISKRVVNLYKIALNYFKSDVKLWISYINFCTQARFHNPVSTALKEMLKVHGDKIDLWLFAARWECEEMTNINEALNYIKTGLHQHPDSTELYSEAFKLELRKGVDEKSLETQALKKAEIYFKTSIKNCNNIEYVISLLKIASEFDFTSELQKQIIDYLTENYWNNEIMWSELAERELNEFHYDNDRENQTPIQLGIAVYKSAIKVLPTKAMWNKYLTKLSELYKNDDHSSFLYETIQEALEQGCEKGFLLEQHFKFWIELTEKSKELEILKKSVKFLPESVDLWTLLLKYYIKNDELTCIEDTFRNATKTLHLHSFPIYKILIEYYTSKSLISKLKSLYEEGITIHPILKPHYIQWLYETKLLKHARNEYKKLARLIPYCYELHTKMLEIEYNDKCQPFCPDSVRTIHKLMCDQFGKDRTDVWIDYVNFELEAGDPMSVSVICNQAKNRLNEELLEDFTTEFTLINT